MNPGKLYITGRFISLGEKSRKTNAKRQSMCVFLNNVSFHLDLVPEIT